MRILMVTPYPPVRDGLAAYAVQSVARLRAEGHDVDVLSPGPSAARYHLDLRGPRGAAALAKRARGYDRLVIQFHPDFFYPLPPSPWSWAAESAALTAAFHACREVEVVVHEIDYRQGRGAGPNVVASRLLWRAVDRITVHTDSERADFVAAFGVDPAKVVVSAHGRDFVRHTRADRATARRTLGLPAEATVYLSIGFLQRHKGFDRAVNAFAGLDEGGARLEIVGSLRVRDEDTLRYLAELQALAASTPGVTLHEDYVGDELFDRWLVAADVVVLPYRAIWSSGVFERAALYGRPVVATRVGGLAEQAAAQIAEGSVQLVADDAELRMALWSMATGAATATVTEGEPWTVPADDLRAGIQEQVSARAAARRGRPIVRPRAVVGAAGGPSPLAADAPLRSLPPMSPPKVHSGRAGGAVVKRVVQRLTAWQYEPLVAQVNALRAATLAAVETPPPPPPPSSD